MSSVSSRSSGRLLSLCRRIYKNQCLVSRTLYSPAALGIDNYLRSRERCRSQFIDMEEKFRSKMNDFVAPDSVNMVFTEDLKNMLFLAEPTPSDVELLEKMMLKFNEQNKDLRFGSFVFGPVIMRTYHVLNKPKEAYNAFNNPGLTGLFDQLSAYQILLDLLFRNEMYSEILEITNYIVSKQHLGAKYPRNVVVLALGACYKINTPETLKYMSEMWSEFKKCGHLPMRRASTFAAALAINQGSPHIAMEIISNSPKQNYVTLRNLKVSALADLNRLEEALPILRSVLSIDSASPQKHTFFKEVMDKIKTAVEKSGKKDLILELERIYDQLSSQGHIVNGSLDDQLCADIEVQQKMDSQYQDRRTAASFELRNNPRDRRRYTVRPGLEDMV